MKLRVCIFALALLSVSCADFPRDPEGTLERVRGEGSFRVGLVAPLAPDGAAEVPKFLAGVSRATAARPHLTTGDAEPLLLKLEEGELDLVIGRFDKKSPWATKVEIGPALSSAKQGKATVELAPAMRVGENAWIALVEGEARNVGAR